ncbi:MAG: threonine--tRNA ligase [Candidatus Omnitrophota bacterium]|nr:MAG: threonine--tRNA ligase [Candidatus Omnitrophota bacterium]
MDLSILRHSSAHILAQAVKRLYPEAKLGIGPATSEGFYYDFDYSKRFSSQDLERIEQEMRRIVEEDLVFSHEQMSKEKAIQIFKELKEDYKLELIKEIEDKEVSVYRQGEFVDLCRGPHLSSTGKVRFFKLLKVSGAYWRGNAKNRMLQRIYGTAFDTEEGLSTYLRNLQEAKKRDHRKLGKDLGLFSFHPEAPATPFYHSKGLILYENLINFWREEHRKEGYLEIKTPLILQEDLWKRSGHYEHYKEHIYFTQLGNKRYVVRPMNCPGALLLYKERQHSYRELPLRFAELGLVHRQELSGVTQGLFRAKAFTIDDAHIFCLPEQLKEEIVKVVNLILRMYKKIGFTDYSIHLSTRPENFIGSEEMWERATTSLSEALKEIGIEYKVKQGEGAFYGPKIDFHIKDCLERNWQCGTIQVDFSMPERFRIECVGKDGGKHPVVMLHRAVFGSIERFLGILIEHYAGDFPFWLAPVQVKVLTIAQEHIPYAQEVVRRLEEASLRIETDFRDERIEYKVRAGELEKVPYLLIIGDREMKEGSVAVRERRKGDKGRRKLEDFVSEVRNY